MLPQVGIASDTGRQRRPDLATILWLTIRVIPIIFYGDKQYLTRYTDCDPRYLEFCQVAPERTSMDTTMIPTAALV
jgi:hypothetical protein